jgi:cell division septation protein DedD
MAATQDDTYREIQLSGKQLVFWFMAGVVILVVTFLAGVQVGRGVLAQRGLPESTLAAADELEPPPPPASATPGTTQAPITANEKLSYAERLGSSEPAAEQLRKPGATAPAAGAAAAPKPEPPAPAKPAPAKTTPPAAAPTPAPAAAAPAPTASEPAGSGFAIQVAALKEASEADAIVKRLASKGYPAYVVSPAKGAPVMYRVRVGKYKDRREADTVAARLEKEEQFKPWVVR